MVATSPTLLLAIEARICLLARAGKLECQISFRLVLGGSWFATPRLVMKRCRFGIGQTERNSVALATAGMTETLISVPGDGTVAKLRLSMVETNEAFENELETNKGKER